MKSDIGIITRQLQYRPFSTSRPPASRLISAVGRRHHLGEVGTAGVGGPRRAVATGERVGWAAARAGGRMRGRRGVDVVGKCSATLRQ